MAYTYKHSGQDGAIQSDIKEFYDSNLGERLQHYVYGNMRVERALDFVLRHMPPGAQSLLDVGCGIGYSSHTFKHHHPHMHVHGVDISAEAIAAAQRLFGPEGVSFTACDLLDWEANTRYDIVVMMDVYEHIPVAQRETLNGMLARLMTERGSIIMTVPSVVHQRYLRQHNPGGLQVVDEDVHEKDVVALAEAVDGRVAYLRYMDVWRPRDYLYAVVERSCILEKNGPHDDASFTKRFQRSLQHRKHAQLVKERLNVQVTSDGKLEKAN